MVGEKEREDETEEEEDEAEEEDEEEEEDGEEESARVLYAASLTLIPCSSVPVNRKAGIPFNR